MKRGFLILSIILLGLRSHSQEADSMLTSYVNPFDSDLNLEFTDEIDLFLSTSSQSTEKLNSYKSSLEKFIERQSKKKRNVKDDKFFIQNLFFKVHNKFLKHYINYVSFDEIFKNGSYDCVTGTALYALILDELGYDLHIYESNFHVFLLVNLSGEDILIESTDFYTGFVDDQDQIASRIAHYQLATKNDDGNYYTYQVNNNRFINSKQLAGLLYFNLAVEQYNNQKFESAMEYLKKAESLYKSQRMLELKGLISRVALASSSSLQE